MTAPNSSDSLSFIPITTADAGAGIYVAACAGCHPPNKPPPFGGLDLRLSIGVCGESPANLLHVVLDGLPASGESQQPLMPAFRGTLSEPQLLALLTYLRMRFAGKPLWPDTEKSIRRASR